MEWFHLFLLDLLLLQREVINQFNIFSKILKYIFIWGCLILSNIFSIVIKTLFEHGIFHISKMRTMSIWHDRRWVDFRNMFLSRYCKWRDCWMFPNRRIYLIASICVYFRIHFNCHLCFCYKIGSGDRGFFGYCKAH